MSRSFLFVPADSERKLAKAASAGADALIIDLEDSVASAARPAARQRAVEFLQTDRPAETWVRINPLHSADAGKDLQQIMPGAPFGIVLPKPTGAQAAIELGKMLDVLEKDNCLAQGSTRILPIATETPAAIFHLHEYAGATERLAGITWGAEDLSAAVGASSIRDADGRWLPPYELARTLCLFAASAAGVAAIDTVFTDFRKLDALAEYAAQSRRDGFAGMLAIHPDQVAVINEAFVPTAAELQRARQIVALFEESPGSGALSIDGEMIDRPHFEQARKILEHATRPKHTRQ